MSKLIVRFRYKNQARPDHDITTFPQESTPIWIIKTLDYMRDNKMDYAILEIIGSNRYTLDHEHALKQGENEHGPSD